MYQKHKTYRQSGVSEEEILDALEEEFHDVFNRDLMIAINCHLDNTVIAAIGS